MLRYTRNVNGTCYQVRNAGDSVRLYRNGVLHSQWNPRYPLKGSLWELFLLAAVLRCDQYTDHSLILGMGGGAAINLFHRYLNPKKQIAIDMDQLHIDLAKKYFHVEETGAHIVHEDAIGWLMNQNTARKYDVIVDDLFAETDGEPYRVASYSSSWYRKLLAQLSSNGVAIFNFADKTEWQRSSLRPVLRKMKNSTVVELRHHQCQNLLVCVYKQQLNMNTMQDCVRKSSAKMLWKYVEQGTYSIRLLAGRRQLR